MTSKRESDSLFSREQFRITRLQVYNWGTFSGLHDVPISERGFLIIGRSGAGKSTLLDVFSVLLTPPRWIGFNAAASEAERTGFDRNLVAYIRGNWGEITDEESGEVANCFLRPSTTWSALALTYKNALGRYLSLVQIFWIRGNANRSTDVKRHYLILERAFDLCELEIFGQSNFEIRKLRQSLPEAFAFNEFPPYCERFCRLLGIESELALRLLHKAQSAKNLDDLNTFLRNFMLDKPETFEVADRLVSEFGELNAAHQAVVTAGEQIQMLAPTREQHRHMDSLILDSTSLDQLRLGIDDYRETQRIKLLKEQVASWEIEAAGTEGEVRQRQGTLDNHSATLRDLERQHREAGGDQIEQWEAEKSRLEGQRTDRLRKRGQAEEACETLGWSLSDSPQAFAELVANARHEIESWDRRSDENRQEQFLLDRKKNDAEIAYSQALKEVQALQRQPSNISADMLEMRQDIAAAIGISESALPFVGELIEVKPDEVFWQNAIERVLHGFALSLLVDESQYSALTNHINIIHLGRRLMYYRTGRPETWQAKPIGANSLVLKLNIKEGRHFDWLQAELRQRFDYACVDSIQAFKSTDRAITREGQVKHSKAWHEKDDRRSVDDRRNWVLGFDNREKLALSQTQAQEIAATITRVRGQIDALSQQDKNRAARAIHCQTLANLQWQEVDVLPLMDRISTIQRQINETREGNRTLLKVSQRIKKQNNLVDRADKNFRASKVAHESVLKQIKDSTLKLETLLQNTSKVSLTLHQTKGLDERFAKQSGAITIESLDKLATAVERELNTEISEIKDEIANFEKEIEACFTEFRQKWPTDACDMDTSLASAPDFFAKLARLETDGLPAYEQRFFELLQNQSQQNLAALSTHLNDARKVIVERMNLVNECLDQAPFNKSANQETYFHINVNDRQLAEVKEFRQDIQQALSHAWMGDRKFAKERFLILQRLVDRLVSQDPENRRWREVVLDVRQHVEFIGREINESGAEVEAYRGGRSKSGGQREKLAATCLAAALWYQLSGNDREAPIYGPIVLDEAFEKADDEFTAIAMNIFTNFGFQMIVATPLKSIMTFEPFVDGACFVDIIDRRESSVLLIDYDDSSQRLKLPENAREETNVEAS